MYIKILVYIIDNQQFKFKISIPFWLASRLPFLFSALRGLGGAVQKTADPTARFRGGGPSRISPSHHTPPHPSNNVPHIILPEYPSYFLTTISPSISFNLLYLRYN